MLSEDGHEVDTAYNGTGAQPLIEQHAYDLIVTDLRMPDIDGPTLYRQMEWRHPDTLKRFIFITGNTVLPHYAGFLRTTKAPVLVKPFNLMDLREAVTRALARL